MSIPVVIFCGGQGTRLRERTREIPKALVPIGDLPILMHIMKYFDHHGFNDFILCAGYKAGKIRSYFAPPSRRPTGWRIRCVDTGANTNTAGRLERVAPLIESRDFFATYGDGLSNVDLKALLRFHRGHGRAATMTCVKPRIQFGVARLDQADVVRAYVEKPPSADWVNGGFFAFTRDVFRYIKGDEVLEQEPFDRLTAARQLTGYRFRGFWSCMDTYKDTLQLNELWARKKAPWKAWR
jgi:glucose-1-phosphate cytidylyltransferase